MPVYRFVVITNVARGDVQRKLREFRDAIRDMRPVFTNDTLPYLRRQTREAFQQESTPSGNPWPDLSASYLARRRREGTGETKLRRFWDLFHSLMGGTNAVESVRKNHLSYGTSDPRAAWHNEGRPGRKTPLPQRTFLDITPQTVDDVADQVIDHLIRVF
ncbi:MAG: hypothetical protein GX785_02130 [Armatimonadetes bacterium]|jgi:phage gpG-like protein|nr:hypothetical protein [Armatimonadota bacterium]